MVTGSGFQTLGEQLPKYPGKRGVIPADRPLFTFFLLLSLIVFFGCNFLLFSFAIIEFIHRILQSVATETEGHFGGGIDQFRQARPLRGVPFPQHVIGLLTGVKILADSATETGVIITAGELVDGFKAVVPRVGALAAQAQLRKIQVQVIDDDEQVFFGDLFGLQPVAHRLTAQVHEGVRLEQQHLLAPVFDPGHVAVAAGLEIFAQVFHHAETDIVAGVFVFGAGVAEAYDQKFHGGVDWFRFRPVVSTE